MPDVNSPVKHLLKKNCSLTLGFSILQTGIVTFPLYTEAIKFFHHEESMVRIAVRTLTLNVYHGEMPRVYIHTCVYTCT